MNGETGTIAIADLAVEVVRKNIKHVYIRVNRSDGRVRVSAPSAMDDSAIRLAVAPRLEWIRRQRLRASLEGGADCAMVSGETHYCQGRPYRLEVVHHFGRPSIRVLDDAAIELRVEPGTSSLKRRAILEQWYRQHLRSEVPALVRKWQPIVGVEIAEWRIKRMKTRWGTCNIRDRRIWLNLELARKAPECLEYVLVHEMVHLLERRHNARFHAYMNRFMPQWRSHRDQLYHSPAIDGCG